MIHKIYTKRPFIFFTETEQGKRTIVATKTLKHPNKAKVYIQLQKQGFINGIHKYGFELIETPVKIVSNETQLISRTSKLIEI